MSKLYSMGIKKQLKSKTKSMPNANLFAFGRNSA
jgi:hypothetical protein